ncbi:MAG: 2-hydroxychromene-2-carboxylate isomerase [Myxococcota bacterium]
MRRPLDFYFDIVCPYAYLASTQVQALCDRYDTPLCWRPFLLGGLLKATRLDKDALFTTTLSEQKAHHNRLDVIRWADVRGVAFAWHPRHPVRTLLTMRALVQLADADGVIADAGPIHGLYRALWVEHRDLDDADVLAQTLDELGLDGAALVDGTRDPAVKMRLRTLTDDLAARGGFGAPAMFLGDQHFWGQDRLHFVQAALQGASQ